MITGAAETTPVVSGDAFITLFEQCKQDLWRTAVAVLGDSHDAADALQETAIKGWQAIPRFEGGSSLHTWLTRILIHACYDMKRKKDKETPFEASSQESLGRRVEETKSNVLHMHEREDDIAERLDVREAMKGLSDDDRVILALFYVNDFPIKHIATILEASEGSVRTRLSRARERFRCIYESNQDGKAKVV